MAVWIQTLYQYAYSGRLSLYPWQSEYRLSTSMPIREGSLYIHGSLNIESLPVCLFGKALSISMAVWIQTLYQYDYMKRLCIYPWQFEYRVCKWMWTDKIHTRTSEGYSYIHGSLIAECKTFNQCELIKFIVHEPTAVHRCLNTDQSDQSVLFCVCAQQSDIRQNLNTKCVSERQLIKFIF